MIEVEAHDGSTAEAETPEAATLAGRTLWDEASGVVGRPQITFTVRHEDGSLNFMHTVTNRKDLNCG